MNYILKQKIMYYFINKVFFLRSFGHLNQDTVLSYKISNQTPTPPYPIPILYFNIEKIFLVLSGTILIFKELKTFIPISNIFYLIDFYINYWVYD